MANIGLVYKIINEHYPDVACYVGSTCRTLRQRIHSHISVATNPLDVAYNKLLYIHMREFGCMNFKIHLLECFEFEDRKILLTRERHWIETLQPLCNVILPIVTPAETKRRLAEWFNANKAYISEYKKQLWVKNKPIAQEKARLSPLVLCQCSSRPFKEINRAIHNKGKKHQEWVDAESDESV